MSLAEGTDGEQERKRTWQKRLLCPAMQFPGRLLWRRCWQHNRDLSRDASSLISYLHCLSVRISSCVQNI